MRAKCGCVKGPYVGRLLDWLADHRWNWVWDLIHGKVTVDRRTIGMRTP